MRRLPLTFSVAEDDSQLREFLEQSGQVGEQIDAGEFSINLKMAVERLREFTLLDPSLYIRYFVASSIARGASKVEVETSSGGTKVVDDGKSLSFDELSFLLPSLLQTPTPANVAGRYAAVGICGARSLDCRSVEITTPKATLKFENEKVNVEPCSGDGQQTLVVTKERKNLKSLVTNMFSKEASKTAENALFGYRYACCEVFLNGVKIRQGHPVLSGPYIEIDSDSAPPVTLAPSKLGVIQTHLPIRGWLDLRKESPCHLSLVLHGLSYEVEDAPVGGLIYCDCLKLDLSFQGLATEGLFQQIMDELPTMRRRGLLSLLGKVETAPFGVDLLLPEMNSVEEKKSWLPFLKESSFLGGRFETLKRQFESFGFLPISGELMTVEPFLRKLFGCCFQTGKAKREVAESFLLESQGFVFGLPQKTYFLRFDPETCHRPGRCFHLGKEIDPEIVDGPNGFQIVFFDSSYTFQHDLYFQFGELTEFGEAVAECVEVGLIPAERTRDFFLALLGWLVEVGGGLSRWRELKDYLVFERQDGASVTYPELKVLQSVPFSLIGETQSELSYALRLSVEELSLLETFREVRLENASPTMRRLDLS